MNNNLFDKVIVSSDDRPMFLNFWPVVSKAWQKYFNIKPTLALVSNITEDDPLLIKLREYGDVHVLPKVEGIPIANLAKIARFIVASRMGDQVCMIEDIDTIPLQRKFVEERLSKRKPGNILAVGHEVLANTTHAGKFPISNITSEGYNFKRLFNPNDLSYEEVIKSFIGLNIVDHKEDISNPADSFSDESIIRALITKHDLHSIIQKVERGVNIHSDWIDRSWWNVDENKLKADGYVICNFLRPFKENMQAFIPIIEHVYGYLPKSKELLVL